MIRIFPINGGICRNPSESSKIPRVVILCNIMHRCPCVTCYRPRLRFRVPAACGGVSGRVAWSVTSGLWVGGIWSLSQNAGARLGVLGGDAHRRCYAHLRFFALGNTVFFSWCFLRKSNWNLFVDPNFFPCFFRAGRGAFGRLLLGSRDGEVFFRKIPAELQTLRHAALFLYQKLRTSLVKQNNIKTIKNHSTSVAYRLSCFFAIEDLDSNRVGGHHERSFKPLGACAVLRPSLQGGPKTNGWVVGFPPLKPPWYLTGSSSAKKIHYNHH